MGGSPGLDGPRLGFQRAISCALQRAAESCESGFVTFLSGMKFLLILRMEGRESFPTHMGDSIPIFPLSLCLYRALLGLIREDNEKSWGDQRKIVRKERRRRRKSITTEPLSHRGPMLLSLQTIYIHVMTNLILIPFRSNPMLPLRLHCVQYISNLVSAGSLGSLYL